MFILGLSTHLTVTLLISRHIGGSSTKTHTLPLDVKACRCTPGTVFPSRHRGKLNSYNFASPPILYGTIKYLRPAMK